MSEGRQTYDVVIIGGALSGAATAILLLRDMPMLRVLIVERTTAFGRKVGEATVEVSAHFLGRVLGLTQHLNESHICKNGMRFWFANKTTQTLQDCSEIGGLYQVRLPAYQVDRSVLDEEVLRCACGAGAELWRPAIVQKIDLNNGGTQQMTVRYQERQQMVNARWVVDASGVAAMLARQEGWWRPNAEHPTSAVWARWKGVKDWDGLELAQKFPMWAKKCYGVRGTATNHLTGDGWWAWLIPLKGGDVSVGVVYDERLVKFAEDGPLGQRLKNFLTQHPVGFELLADARWEEGDVHSRKHLPYYSTTFAGNGFALVGDAAAFIDPLYSPGMDWISFTTFSTARLICAERRGDAIAPLVARHNRDFARSHRRWFEALYKDKYEYIAEYDLWRLCFRMDLGLYYLGVVSQPYKFGPEESLREPVFSTAPSTPIFHLMRLYNRRFAQIARARRRRGTLGRYNAHQRTMIQGYTISVGSSWPIFKSLAGWFWLELTEGWRSWFQPRAQRRDIELAPVGARQNGGEKVALGELPQRKLSA